VLVDDNLFRIRPMRRAVDILVSAAMLILTAPVLLAAAAAVLLSDGRPVLFRQERLGEGGVPFRLTKLRTMRGGGPGAAVTAIGDERITKVGLLLRRTALDELPQLWDVLRGRMTLVGPRPESIELAARYPSSCRAVLMARPGLTGPAQLRYREASALPPPGIDVEAWYLEVLVPLRVQADLTYLARPTIGATFRVLVLTAGFVLGLTDVQAPPLRDAALTGRSRLQPPPSTP
jgi:lipopolysaccharide/colanic/teichoic acid biosynthesis glycosyltransferase